MIPYIIIAICYLIGFAMTTRLLMTEAKKETDELIESISHLVHEPFPAPIFGLILWILMVLIIAAWPIFVIASMISKFIGLFRKDKKEEKA